MPYCVLMRCVIFYQSVTQLNGSAQFAEPSFSRITFSFAEFSGFTVKSGIVFLNFIVIANAAIKLTSAYCSQVIARFWYLRIQKMSHTGQNRHSRGQQTGTHDTMIPGRSGTAPAISPAIPVPVLGAFKFAFQRRVVKVVAVPSTASISTVLSTASISTGNILTCMLLFCTPSWFFWHIMLPFGESV